MPELAFPPKSRPDRAAVRASFDAAADDYGAHAQVQRDLARWVAEWLPANKTGRALEVGAGPGVFTQLLLPWPDRLQATDLSPAMCRRGATAFPEISWSTMTAEEPLPGPWDWIFSSGALQWISDPDRIFPAWRAVMSRGGRMLLGIFVADTLWEWTEVAGSSGPVPWRAAQEWEAQMTAAGFRVIRSETSTRVYHYANARALLRSLHGVGAAPERRYSAVALRRFLAAYDRRFAGPNGVRATWSFFRCEAVAP